MSLKNQMGVLAAGLVGLSMMYLLDPVFGKRRRSILGSKTLHYSKVARRAVKVSARDAAHRLQGLVAETKHAFRWDEAFDDVLADRVRSAMGRVVSHSSSIDVHARDGRVTLSGDVLDEEHHRLLNRVRRVRGVHMVDDRLNRHKERGAESALQGGEERMPRHGFMRSNWSPAVRALAILAGVAAILFGVTRRQASGALAGGAGAMLMARGLTNLDTRRIAGIGAGRRAIDLNKTIHIAAPIERVYSVCTDHENFPVFMSHVREVRDLGNGRSHWVVRGPANTTVEWDAVTTQNVPNKIIAWKTEPGSIVGHAGIVRFDTEGDKTRVQIRLSYNPPAGALGHSLAWLTGADPKSALDDDLVRMKSFVETGIRPHDAAGRYVG